MLPQAPGETPPGSGPDPTAATETLRKLDERVTKLESKLGKKDGWDIIATLSPFVTAIVIAVMGYYLKDTVDQAFKREELHLSSVQDMRELLLALRGPDVTREAAAAAALTLAAFGHYAIPSLMITLADADDVRAPAAEEALLAVGATEPEAVCGRVSAVLNDRTGRYAYATHLAALRLIGGIPCASARSAVTEYQREFEQLTASQAAEKYSSRFRQPLTPDSVDELKTQCRETLRQIDAASAR